MTVPCYSKDLIVLTADREMEFAVRGVLSRGPSLSIREITVDFRTHPEHDPGCLVRGHDFLKPFVNHYAHALILLDRDGCGREAKPRETLEAHIEEALSSSGWEDRAAAVVIDPELEIWIWSNSPHVDSILGWQNKQPDLRSWLQDKEYLSPGDSKPSRPKEALEDALKEARKPRSSSIYSQLAGKVSLDRCIDKSFIKLKLTLQTWFSSSADNT